MITTGKQLARTDKLVETVEKVVKHQHIWKYKGAGYERVCESPFGSQGCGRVELKDESGWPS